MTAVTAPRRLRAAWLAAILGLAACGDAEGPVQPGSRTTSASGQVHTLSGSAPAGLRVVLRSGTMSSSAVVNANGTFQVQAVLPGDSIDVVIDTNGTARTHLPSLIRVPAGTNLAGVSVLLVPARFTVTGGAFGGQAIDVSLDDAFRPPCTTPGDTNCDGFFPRVWFSGLRLWHPTALPVPVAFDHARSHRPFSAADSALFWSFAARMNSDVGMQLFRPARLDQVPVNANNQPTAGILVRVDTTITGFGALTNWWWNAAGDMYAGLLRPRSLGDLRSGGLMIHELLHTQGIKHSCSWTTVMGGYSCGYAANLSLHDVAYFQLAMQVRARQRATGAQHAMIAALQGERVLMRSLPPLAPAALRTLELMRSDSIMHGDHAH